MRVIARQIPIALLVLGGLWLLTGGAARIRVSADLGAQVSGLAGRHLAGQTFLTWREVSPPALGEQVTMSALSAARRVVDSPPRLRYRIYRSTTPVASLDGIAAPIGEVPQLSGWNADFYGRTNSANLPAWRYVVDAEQGPVPPGTGLFVHHPSRAQTAYYAVTVVVDGVENRLLGPSNVLSTAIAESVGEGVPVLQRIERPANFKYVDRPTLHFYVRWEPGAHSSVPGRPIDYLVAVPAGARKAAPVGVHMHCWGASLTGCSGWWFNAEKGAVHISSNQIPYDWWTGYHERLGTARPPDSPAAWRDGVVRPYTQRRLLSFLQWAAEPFQLDLTRAFAGGESMGGTGALMLAIHHPESVAWAIGWVGVHIPAASPQFKSSFETVYGKPEWNVKFEDGTPVWNHFNSAWYLRQHPGRDIGFLTFANGKNDGAIGWSQAVEFLRALQETRQPHMFVWGGAGHGQRAYMPVTGSERVMPLDISTDRSLPAFTRSTLDDDLGDGTPSSGSPSGQVNRYVAWDPASIVDEAERWEVTVRIVDGAPRDAATADITPRRLQRFRPSAGVRLSWTNTTGSARTPAQSGTVAPDAWGLVTLPQVEIRRAGNRIQLKRSP